MHAYYALRVVEYVRSRASHAHKVTSHNLQIRDSSSLYRPVFNYNYCVIVFILTEKNYNRKYLEKTTLYNTCNEKKKHVDNQNQLTNKATQ